MRAGDLDVPAENAGVAHLQRGNLGGLLELGLEREDKLGPLFLELPRLIECGIVSFAEYAPFAHERRRAINERCRKLTSERGQRIGRIGLEPKRLAGRGIRDFADRFEDTRNREETVSQRS